MFCHKSFVYLSPLECTRMSREEKNKLRFVIALITEFANKHGINEKQAYNYMVRFNGLSHILTYYDVIHTLSFEDAIESAGYIYSFLQNELKFCDYRRL